VPAGGRTARHAPGVTIWREVTLSGPMAPEDLVRRLEPALLAAAALAGRAGEITVSHTPGADRLAVRPWPGQLLAVALGDPGPRVVVEGDGIAVRTRVSISAGSDLLDAAATAAILDRATASAFA
jgi:hypothetical protein